MSQFISAVANVAVINSVCRSLAKTPKANYLQVIALYRSAFVLFTFDRNRSLCNTTLQFPLNCVLLFKTVHCGFSQNPPGRTVVINIIGISLEEVAI